LRSRGSISAADSRDSFDSTTERGTYRVVVLGKKIILNFKVLYKNKKQEGNGW
jgi:hypothetical protein